MDGTRSTASHSGKSTLQLQKCECESGPTGRASPAVAMDMEHSFRFRSSSAMGGGEARRGRKSTQERAVALGVKEPMIEHAIVAEAVDRGDSLAMALCGKPRALWNRRPSEKRPAAVQRCVRRKEAC